MNNREALPGDVIEGPSDWDDLTNLKMSNPEPEAAPEPEALPGDVIEDERDWFGTESEAEAPQALPGDVIEDESDWFDSEGRFKDGLPGDVIE